MALRTDIDRVKKLIDVDPEAWDGADGIDLDTCMTSANLTVTDLCTASGYTDERLELIERWLAAHFYGVIDASAGRTTVDQVATVKEQYSFRVGEGFSQTVYGQQAKVLDYKGNLAAIDNLLKKKLPARIGKVLWLGGVYDPTTKVNIPDNAYGNPAYDGAEYYCGGY